MALKADANTFVSLLSIVALLASLASTIDLKQFLLKIKRPKGILLGLLCQYGILPVTAYLLASLFSLHPSLGIALVIMGTCPGGAMSNFWCFVFNADLPLSIAMTTCSSTLSFAFIAMNGALYIPLLSEGTQLSMDWPSLALSVAAVLVGICIGMMMAYVRSPKLLKFMGVLGTVTMLVILVWTLTSVGRSDAKLRGQSVSFFFVFRIFGIRCRVTFRRSAGGIGGDCFDERGGTEPVLWRVAALKTKEAERGRRGHRVFESECAFRSE